MTISMAADILKDMVAADEETRGALAMAVNALDSWEEHLDIECDYRAQADELKKMIQHYKQDAKPNHVSGVWVCPACGSRIGEHHSYCHRCGKKIGWGGVLQKKRKK